MTIFISRTTSNIPEESQESLDNTMPDTERHTDRDTDEVSVHEFEDCESLTSSLNVPSSYASRTSRKRKFADSTSKLLEENKKARDKIIEAYMEKNTTAKQEDDVDMFYKSIALSVKRLPPHLVSKAKLQHLQIVTSLELEANQPECASGISRPSISNQNFQFDNNNCQQYQLPNNSGMQSISQEGPDLNMYDL